MNSGTTLVMACVGFLVVLGLFLLFRKVVLWYWGISAIQTRLDTLIQQNGQLLALLGQRSEPPPAAPTIE